MFVFLPPTDVPRVSSIVDLAGPAPMGDGDRSLGTPA